MLFQPLTDHIKITTANPLLIKPTIAVINLPEAEKFQNSSTNATITVYQSGFVHFFYKVAEHFFGKCFLSNNLKKLKTASSYTT